MNKRVFIIHGWDDQPSNGWFPWLRKELTHRGAEVHVPSMPDPAHPSIDTWVPFLKHLIRAPDAQTFLVGHSIGGQVILSFLETLPAAVKVGGVVLVATWVTLKPAALEDEDAQTVATPWLERPLSWPKIRARMSKVTTIMSDDDQFVALDNGKLLARELGAKLVVEHQKHHLGGQDGVLVLPSVLWELEGMMGA